MPIPLYGFASGDTLGLLIFAEEQETLSSLASRLQQASGVRRMHTEAEHLRVVFRDRVLPPELTIAQTGMQPCDRFSIVARAKDHAS